MHFYKGEYEESGYAYDEFSIKKIDDENFIFENTRGGRKEETTGNAEEIIDNIAEFIAKTNVGPYEEMSGEIDINHVTNYCNRLDEI